MTVAELIEHLKTFPQDLPVAYSCYSERVLLTKEEVHVGEALPARADGWVANNRPDKESIQYCFFPGN